MLPEPNNKIIKLLERIKSETTQLVSILIDKLRHMFLGRMSDWIHLAQEYGQVAGICEYSNEPSGSIKCEEFLDYLRTG
jgi:hypothetical protein